MVASLNILKYMGIGIPVLILNVGAIIGVSIWQGITGVLIFLLGQIVFIISKVLIKTQGGSKDSYTSPENKKLDKLMEAMNKK